MKDDPTVKTESAVAGESIKDQLLFLKTLMDTIPQPIFYKDIQGRYIGHNQTFEEYIGRPGRDIVGRTVFEVAPPDLAEKYHEMDEALFRNPGTQEYETSVVYADGVRHDVVFHKATFTNSAGRVAGLVGVIHDITDRRRAEKALEKARRELEKRVSERTIELDAANRELRKEVEQRAEAERALIKQSEELKRFAHSIVHDLKSPTVGIYGLVRKMKSQYEDQLDERGKTYCDQIMKASELVAALVEKINAYMASRESPLKIEQVNINDILEIVKEEFSARLSLREIRWESPERAIEVRADRLAMLRLFRNLVDNALKHGGDAMNRLTVDYAEKPDSHYFTFSDNGVGMDRNQAMSIFGVFHRHPAGPAPGAGLGLSIVREIVQRHGGDIGVEAAPNRGTTFLFHISKSISA